MPQKKMATLRYFGRFKGDFGYLRAVVRYDTTRKFITTPLVITKDQLSRLDTAGGIKDAKTYADLVLSYKLKLYSKNVWSVVKPLIAAGEFDATPSTALTTAVLNYKAAEEAAAQRRAEQRAEESFNQKREAAKARGIELRLISIEEITELENTLPPEEYAALWKKGGEK